MISAKKLMNIKVVELIKIYNFYFGHLFIRQNDNNIVNKFYISLIVWYVNLWTMYSTTLSDEQMTNTKVVDLDGFYNFYVDDFFSWNHLLFQNVVSSWYFLKFKFWSHKTKSHEKMTKIKVVDLEKL
jgi:hypothetical protein